MRNSEVVTLVETVNTVMDTKSIQDDQLNSIEKWAQMGVDEFGTSPYKVIAILAKELGNARGSREETIVVDLGETDQVTLGTAEPVAPSTPLPDTPSIDPVSTNGHVAQDTPELDKALAAAHPLSW